MCLPYSFNNQAMAQSYIVSIPLPALNQFEARLRHIISSGFFFYVSTDFSLSPAKWSVKVLRTFFWGQPGCLSHLPHGCLGSCRWPCMQSAYISSGGWNEAPDRNQCYPGSLVKIALVHMEGVIRWVGCRLLKLDAPGMSIRAAVTGAASLPTVPVCNFACTVCTNPGVKEPLKT